LKVFFDQLILKPHFGSEKMRGNRKCKLTLLNPWEKLMKNQD
jgi:hypothetical protein